MEYVTVLTNENIVKLGYCCEPKGIIYPIYLKIDGKEEEFYIGHEGMFEFQPEVGQITIKDGEALFTNVTVTEVKLPKDIKFTLDFVTE